MTEQTEVKDTVILHFRRIEKTDIFVLCFSSISLRPRGGHRDVEVGVGVGDVGTVLKLAAVEVEAVTDEAKEGEEHQEEDEVAGEVDKMGPPSWGPFDIHLQLLEVGVGRRMDTAVDHQLQLGK